MSGCLRVSGNIDTHRVYVRSLGVLIPVYKYIRVLLPECLYIRGIYLVL
jgi:hypothetical protein